MWSGSGTSGSIRMGPVVVSEWDRWWCQNGTSGGIRMGPVVVSE